MQARICWTVMSERHRPTSCTSAPSSQLLPSSRNTCMTLQWREEDIEIASQRVTYFEDKANNYIHIYVIPQSLQWVEFLEPSVNSSHSVLMSYMLVRSAWSMSLLLTLQRCSLPLAPFRYNGAAAAMESYYGNAGAMLSNMKTYVNALANSTHVEGENLRRFLRQSHPNFQKLIPPFSGPKRRESAKA